MLRLLFHRASPLVRTLYGVGFGLSLASLWMIRSLPHRDGIGAWLHYLALLQFCFIQGCVYFPWYRNLPTGTRDRYLGINLHFWKARVPTAYIAPLQILLYVWLGNWVIPCVANILYAPISFINFVLIYLHFRDPHLEPPNLYSTGRY